MHRNAEQTTDVAEDGGVRSSDRSAGMSVDLVMIAGRHGLDPQTHQDLAQADAAVGWRTLARQTLTRPRTPSPEQWGRPNRSPCALLCPSCRLFSLPCQGRSVAAVANLTRGETHQLKDDSHTCSATAVAQDAQSRPPPPPPSSPSTTSSARLQRTDSAPTLSRQQ
jgi:hypothetical protein